MIDRNVKIGTVLNYFNLATGEDVKLEVVIANGIMCDGCYFNTTDRHCPNEWACGAVARLDKTAIIFTEVK